MSTSGLLLGSEALLCGLSGDVEVRPDGGPAVSLGVCSLGRGEEVSLGVAQLFVGLGQPVEDVDSSALSKGVAGGSFTEGRPSRIAVRAQGGAAEADYGGELAVGPFGGLGGVGTALGGAVKAGLTVHSGRPFGLGGEDALQGVVLVGVVGDFVLPAVPDDVEPGSAQDADGVGVVVSSVAGVAVELVGPGVGAAAVAGEVGDGVAELLVAGPSEADAVAFPGRAGAGGDAGQAGQGLGAGEAGAAVTDLAEQPGSADGPGARQAGEDQVVVVGRELLADLLLEGGGLLAQDPQGREVGQGDVGSGEPVVAGQAAGGVGEFGVELLGGLAL